MKIVPLVRTEVARLTSSRLGIASLIALMIVPIIYGGLYLWGNQDPYNNLRTVPAAIVVADTGATQDGDQVNYGHDAAKTLVDGKKFGWHIVSASAAAAGVNKGTYDFSVTFPASFSRDLTSAATTSPTKAKLVLTTNDINSYLSTTLAKQATTAVQTAITQQVAQAGSHKLLNAVASLRSGLVDAKGGAAKLADGSQKTADGAATLAAGLAQLKTGTASLPANSAALNAGAAKLNSGLGALSAGMTKYRAQLAQALQFSALPPSAQTQLLDAFDQLHGGARSAKSGAAQLKAGTAKLSASAPALTTTVSKAASGASQLASGTAKVSTGASKLDSSLGDGVNRVPTTTAASRLASAKALADPVVVQQHAITEAQNYGAGLAPFFISLSAWIGIYALFLIIRPLSRRALTAVRRPIRTTVAGWITPAVFGIVQMVALFAVLTLALHLRIADPAGLLLFMAFVSVTFAAIVLALNALLGSVGQFLGLLLMIVQLVTAGGTFPWQTLPGPLRVLHQVLPMSHAVDGVRQLMYGGSFANLWAAITPMLIWLVAALAVTVLAALRQGRTRTLTQLRPSAIGG